MCINVLSFCLFFWPLLTGGLLEGSACRDRYKSQGTKWPKAKASQRDGNNNKLDSTQKIWLHTGYFWFLVVFGIWFEFSIWIVNGHRVEPVAAHQDWRHARFTDCTERVRVDNWVQFSWVHQSKRLPNAIAEKSASIAAKHDRTAPKTKPKPKPTPKPNSNRRDTRLFAELATR